MADELPPTSTAPPTPIVPPTSPAGTTLLTTTEPPATTEPAITTDPAAPASAAPEAYADYTVPDGYTLDPEIKTKADAIFRGLNLTQPQAQSLVDFFRETTQAQSQAPYEAYRTMTDGWKQSSMDHPDLKGKLTAGGPVLTAIGRALSSLEPALATDFRSIMDLTGVGNHPAMIRVLNHFATRLNEGSHVAGNGPSTHGQSASGATAPPTAAQALYPNLPSSTR